MRSLLNTHDKMLTLRKTEYLSLVALGCKNHIIADYLCVSKSTVKKTLELIFKNLNAKDRANAVTIAFAHDILSIDFITRIAVKYDIHI